MSIQPQVNELKSIEIELKSLSSKTKKLRARKKKLEEKIASYIRKNDLPGVKHQGVKVLVQEKTRRANKPSKQRDEDAIKILSEYGVRNPEIVLEQILEARKGEAILVDGLKMSKNKNK